MAAIAHTDRQTDRQTERTDILAIFASNEIMGNKASSGLPQGIQRWFEGY